MASIGLPVPPGFTISTEVCALFFKAGNKLPAQVEKEIIANLRRLEKSPVKSLAMKRILCWFQSDQEPNSLCQG